MAITLYSTVGTIKDVALAPNDRERLSRSAQRGDTLAICECEYPHRLLEEAADCRQRVLSILFDGDPQVEHGPRFDGES